MDGMKSFELFDLGYAIPSYDIARDLVTWRYRDETVELPNGAVPTERIPGAWFVVGKWERVKDEQGKRAASVL